MVEVARDDDPFRYLEDLSSPRTQAFLREEAAQARAALDRIPGRAALAQRIRVLAESSTGITSLALASGRVFYLKQAPRQASPVLCVREGLAGPERVLLDPQRFARQGEGAAIEWFVPSHDGRHVAYGVSRGTSEDVVLRVLAVDRAADLSIEIDRARFNANLSWHPDNRSFYYARVPDPGAKREANIRVYRHVLGREAARDEIVFAPGVGGARDVPQFAYPFLVVPEDSRHAYAIAHDGARREVSVHITDQKDLGAARPLWRKVAGFEDEVTAIEAWKDDLYLLSHRGAPRSRVLWLNAKTPEIARARVAVPQGDTVIQSMALSRDALYLRTMLGGVDRLERLPFGLIGKPAEFVKTPFDNAIAQLVAHPRRPGALLRLQGWVEPPVIAEVDKGGNLRNTGLQPPPGVDVASIDEVRLYAPGHDGVKIPVTLIYGKTTQLNGNNPTLVIGYGSHGVSMAPIFDPAGLAWVERGGVLAIAHLRGGGEYGEPWHAAGRGAAKTTTVLDMVAVCEFLVGYGFTNPKRLAVMGSGAGAIAAAGAIVRRPELFAALVARAPLMDMLRFETMAGGPANVSEFGSATTPAGARLLRAVSAYHQVREGAPYPAALLIAGLHDPQVDAWQAAKMAARLRAANAAGKPVLLRIDPESGPRYEQRIQDLADIYSFLLWQFEDPQFQLPAPPPTPAAAAADVVPGQATEVTPAPTGAPSPPPR